MPQDHNRPVNKRVDTTLTPPKRRFWKNFIIAFFLSGILTIGSKAYHTIIETQDVVWQARNSPYDTKSEFLQLRWLMRARASLSEFGLERSGFALQILEEYSKKIYLRAKAKIPEDDIAWIEYLYMHQLYPLYFCNKNEITNHERQYLWDTSRPLLVDFTKIDYVDKITRFELIDAFLSFFSYGPVTENSLMLQDLYILASKASHKMNTNDFSNIKNKDMYIPFRLYLIKLKLGVYILDNGICWPKFIDEMNDNMRKLNMLEIAIVKSDNKQDDASKRNLQHYKEMRPRVESLLKQQCNLNLK